MEPRAPVILPLAPIAAPGFRPAAEVVATLRAAGHGAFLVGGGVRDLVLGRKPKDFDVVTAARPEDIAALFRHTIPVGAQFGVMTVIHRGHQFEVATYRAEGGYADARRPGWVRFADLRADLARRDFTINGLVLDPETGEVSDWVGGLRDLRAGIVRTIGDPAERFSEDALRVVRAIRFAARFGFRLERETRRALVAAADTVRKVSIERVFGEIEAMWGQPSRAEALRLLGDTGALRSVLPEVAALAADGPWSPWERTLRRMEALGAHAPGESVWAALLADVANPAERPGAADADGPLDPDAAARAGKTLNALRAPRRTSRAVGEILARRWIWPRAHAIRPGSLARILRRDRDGALVAFFSADAASGGHPGAARPLVRLLRRLRDEGRMVGDAARPPVTGDTLRARGLEPGSRFPLILAAMERDWLEGKLATPDAVEAWLDAVASGSTEFSNDG